VKFHPFHRRQADEEFADLLENYLVRAEALADAGGGPLWVVEPGLSAELLSDVTRAVARHLDDHGVLTDGMSLLTGTTTAVIAVLPAAQEGLPAELPPVEGLRPAEPALPSPRERTPHPA
jgi:hypothetical protein